MHVFMTYMLDFHTPYAAICGGCAILDKSNNLIEHLLGTPQYPGHYQTHLDCTWKLAAPEGFSLRLNFHDLDLEEHDSCRHDYLSVQYLNDHGQVLRWICMASVCSVEGSIGDLVNKLCEIDCALRLYVVTRHLIMMWWYNDSVFINYCMSKSLK